ncbi:hypothetical protein B0T16DRAFT_420504 [Cercophora newfieldiana]|uniref:Uncharacterized protein n=1 Tax=Cercophora newfieldiana TaxID=92897 RepID=A0AA39XYB4_9PEZI|nr:hypothetical protein B0T16DRAFT_420504 [Cercophora newfieldiana]
MDKCWFVLRQTHYTAPVYASPSMAFGKAEGPLRLGHVLPGPRSVDNIINTGGILDFHKDMRITKKNTVNFRYSSQAEQAAEVNAEGGFSIAAAAGVMVNVDAGAMFRQIMGNNWQIDRLETQIMQPTLAYIEKCRTSTEVASWIATHKMLGAWKLYIITGLMIARGARNERTEWSERGANAGTGADLPGVATGKLSARHATTKDTEVSGEHEDDFVWAIRLSLVSKGILSNAVEVEPYTEGAVLAPSPENVDAKTVLAKEGLLGNDVHTIEVLQVDSVESEQQFFVTIDGL